MKTVVFNMDRTFCMINKYKKEYKKELYKILKRC